MKLTAIATWSGGPRAGEGSVDTSSGVFRNVIYTFGTCTKDIPCTNPVEMLAAAEASCISMMVAKELAAAGIESEKIETEAELTLLSEKNGWSIPSIHLRIKALVPLSDSEMLQEVVRRAKENCAISRTLKSEITVETVLEPVAELAMAARV